MRSTAVSAVDIANALARRPRQSRGWYRIRGYCHNGSSDSNSLAVRPTDDGRGVAVKCWAGCPTPVVRKAIETQMGIVIWGSEENNWERKQAERYDDRYEERYEEEDYDPLSQKYMFEQQSKEESDLHLRLWEKTQNIPVDTEHPARKWVSNRNLYHPRIPLPRGLRWLDKDTIEISRGYGGHVGVGALAAVFAKFEDWMYSVPSTPGPAAIELINVDSDGLPCLDGNEERGLKKRTYGSRAGTVFMIGNPTQQTEATLYCVEGVADALAVASRREGVVISFGGTSGMKFPEWITAFDSVTLYGDRDKAGEKAGRELRRWVRIMERMQNGYPPLQFFRMKDAKDVAEWAAKQTALSITDEQLEDARQFAKELVDEGEPHDEAARMAIQLLG